MGYSQLDPQTLEEIKQRVDIYDVISEYVVLHKRGKSLVGLCPFHNEKSPSFNVSADKQLYHCFGCGAGGNAITFLMELRKQSFYEVALDLARRYQIPLKTLNPEEHQKLQRQLSLKEQLYEIVAVAVSFYQHALRQPEGEHALNYLKQKRHLNDEIITQFQLGYAPAGWETLYRYLVEQKRYPVALVEQAGLIKPRKSASGHYDTFRDRIMIPIHDSQGRAIAFGSRTLGTDEPKYLNSPETPLFDKGKTLFALDKATKRITEEDRVIVVEGYFDAIALHSVGITNGVASLGTAFSGVQLKQLLRYTDSKQIIFNFDSDPAGIKATERAINEISSLVYSGQIQLRILNLPDGKDADEFLNSSAGAAEKFRHLIETAPLWFEWQIEQLLSKHNLKEADHFQIVVQTMVKLLSQLENIPQRIYYIHYCADLLSQGDKGRIRIYEDSLSKQLKKSNFRIVKDSKKTTQSNDVISEEKNRLEYEEALLLKIYLHCPHHRAEIQAQIEEKEIVFSVSYHRFLWQQILTLEDDFLSNPEPDNLSNRLLSLLQDKLLSFPEQAEKVRYLFYLDEIGEKDIAFASTNLEKVFLSLEFVKYTNYKRYCIEQLDKATAFKDQLFWSQELSEVSQKLQELMYHSE
ncbi:DNA primase [Gloeothece citriformis PCC 7424]|uniref:DNA primase n=1 Tax=Gloeothece citriformis (strain PCC 7424) TaxID=65393 RepID=B7KGX1_GLOC7|nr:DNA primase [Gloeothece citriformis]ACK73458.1 DNA primase [Gloeothece citriformis PCC 7424]